MKVMIVDDHVLFREGLASLLQREPEVDILGLAGSVQEAIELADCLRPEIILMDYRMPDGTGADATRAILSKNPTCKVVFLTVSDDDECLFAAIRSGAKGYLTKNVAPKKLIAALRSVMQGEGALSRVMTLRVMEEMARLPETHARPSTALTGLAPREVDVLRGIANGKTNQEIADCLYLSENTVKFYVHSILEKLKFGDRREAAMFARQRGMV